MERIYENLRGHLGYKRYKYRNSEEKPWNFIWVRSIKQIAKYKYWELTE